MNLLNPFNMEAIIFGWLELVFRWLHVVTAIAWIGSSFYFNWLDLSIRDPEDPPQPIPEHLKNKILGDLWAVHGGGFYYIQKFKVAPDKLPKTLHWFKWESYMTWVSGFCLLSVLYFIGADVYLVDKSVADLTNWQAIGFCLGVLILGWLIYDSLCKLGLAKRPGIFVIVGAILVTGIAFGLTQLLGARGAYLMVGAMIGTIMTANVFFVIIPSQKELVAAVKQGREPNPDFGKNAKLRSFHNNYFTLPVIFLMISNHYAFTYGHTYNWIILMILALGSALIRHWFNLRNKGHLNRWIFPVALLLLLGLMFATLPRKSAITKKVSSAQVEAIIKQRCVTCHSINPTDDVFKIAPLGFKLDTMAEVKASVRKIKERAIDSNTMPSLNNKTKMTMEERELLKAWIEQGAKLD